MFIGTIIKLEELFNIFLKQNNFKKFDNPDNIQYNINILNDMFKTKYTIDTFDYNKFYLAYINIIKRNINNTKIDNIPVYHVSNNFYFDEYIHGFKLCTTLEIDINELNRKIKKYSKILDSHGIKNYKIFNSY